MRLYFFLPKNGIRVGGMRPTGYEISQGRQAHACQLEA
jgi:hypothetical protein